MLQIDCVTFKPQWCGDHHTVLWLSAPKIESVTCVENRQVGLFKFCRFFMICLISMKPLCNLNIFNVKDRALLLRMQ